MFTCNNAPCVVGHVVNIIFVVVAWNVNCLLPIKLGGVVGWQLQRVLVIQRSDDC